MNINEYLTEREKKEPVPIASFLEYEAFCNRINTGSRKNGILSEEIYNEAVDDPSTIFVDIEGTKQVPVLVDLSYGIGLGYDQERAKQYAGDAKQVCILSVPLGSLDVDFQRKIGQSFKEIETVSDTRAVYFSDHEGRDKSALQELLSKAEIEYNEVPLEDDRSIEKQASLSMYVSDFVNVTQNASVEKQGIESAQRYFDANTLPHLKDVKDAVLLKKGNSFLQEELDDIWSLYQDRFQFLGENHPISMEDSREDFMSLFTDEQTLVSIKYKDGQPVCFTYIMEDLSKLYWLNLPYLEKLKLEAAETATTIFFPGIVASGSGNNYAAEIIMAFRDAAAKSGVSARVIFENTNLSETYIPQIVHDIVSETGEFDTSYPKKVDEIQYRLFIV